MNRKASPKDSLLPLLNQYYERIRDIEIAQELWAGPTDYRPRIEIFHDAIRAYTSGVSIHAPGSRLSLEWLAWDIDTLRVMQNNPLAPLPNTQRQSAKVEVTAASEKPSGKRDRLAEALASRRETRSELGELYGKYMVLFVALLAEMADMNYQSRRDEQDLLVEELSALEKAARGKPVVDVQALAAAEVQDPDLRAAILAQMPRGKAEGRQAQQALRHAMQQADARIAGLEKLHTTWLAGQLAAYEQGKPLVQALLNEGMNIAGKFLQETISRGAGRGRGR
jgi:hypothetical protein